MSAVKRLRRPRWLYCLHAWATRCFWLPCSRCGHYWSGWEWERDGYPRMGPILCADDREGQGVCTECAEHGTHVGTPDFMETVARMMELKRRWYRRQAKWYLDYGDGRGG